MALEFKTGDSYSDRVGNSYKFIGTVALVAYFIDSSNVVRLRYPDGAMLPSGVDNLDIVTHIVPVVKRKGFAYMFDKPVQTKAGHILLGVIGKRKEDAIGFGNAFAVTARDSVVAVTVDHKEGDGLA